VQILTPTPSAWLRADGESQGGGGCRGEKGVRPQRLKSLLLADVFGTTEVVPFPVMPRLHADPPRHTYVEAATTLAAAFSFH
jgi:hypothetical protein